jgi:hypothetical protein
VAFERSLTAAADHDATGRDSRPCLCLLRPPRRPGRNTSRQIGRSDPTPRAEGCWRRPRSSGQCLVVAAKRTGSLRHRRVSPPRPGRPSVRSVSGCRVVGASRGVGAGVRRSIVRVGDRLPAHAGLDELSGGGLLVGAGVSEKACGNSGREGLYPAVPATACSRITTWCAVRSARKARKVSAKKHTYLWTTAKRACSRAGTSTFPCLRWAAPIRGSGTGACRAFTASTTCAARRSGRTDQLVQFFPPTGKHCTNAYVFALALAQMTAKIHQCE